MTTKEKQNARARRYPIAVYIIFALLGIILIIIPVLGNQETIFAAMLSMGTDFVGVALIFFVLRLFLLDEKDNIEESLEEIKSDFTSNITGELNKYYSINTPDKIYHSSQSFRKEFNLDLTSDFSKSSFYLFRGVSAKYVPVRILGTQNTLSFVKVIMLNPNNDRIINLRAKDRTLNPKYIGKSIPQLANEIKEEIFITIIGLYECRHVCPIEILYDNSGTSVFRLEIFEQHTYISLYHTDDSLSNSFPETIRYSKGTLFHQIYRMDSFRLFDISQNKLAINNATSEKDLYDHLKELGSKVDRKTIEYYQSAFSNFKDEVIEEINIASN